MSQTEGDHRSTTQCESLVCSGRPGDEVDLGYTHRTFKESEVKITESLEVSRRKGDPRVSPYVTDLVN